MDFCPGPENDHKSDTRWLVGLEDMQGYGVRFDAKTPVGFTALHCQVILDLDIAQMGMDGDYIWA